METYCKVFGSIAPFKFVLVYCKHVSANASKVLNFLRHTLWGATTEAKSVTYKCVVRPLLEYACTVWNPHTVSDRAAWNLSNSVGWIGFVEATVPLCRSIGASHQMSVYKSCVGLLSHLAGTI